MTEDTRNAAHRFYDTLNRAFGSDVSLLDRLLAPDVVDHNPTPGMAPGREGVKRAFAELRAAFPDYRGTVEDMVVEGDKAACRITGRMTHRGRQVEMHGIDIPRRSPHPGQDHREGAVVWPPRSGFVYRRAMRRTSGTTATEGASRGSTEAVAPGHPNT